MLLVAPLASFTQRAEVHTYTQLNGMPFFDLSDMIQDQRGVLWFSNGKQLYFYDGSRFHALPAGKNVRPNYINRLLIAGDSLYAVDPNTVYVVSGDSLQVSRLSSFPDPFIDMIRHRNTWWWLKTDGIYSFNGNRAVQHTGIRGSVLLKNNLQHLYVLNDSVLLTFEPEKALYFFNLNSKECYTHETALRDLTLTPDKKIMALVTGKGLFSLRTTDGGRHVHYELKAAHPVQAGKLLSLTSDHRSRVWFIQPGHAVFCIDSNGLIRRYDELAGFPGGSVKRLFADREDNIWAYGISSLYKISNSPALAYTRAEGLRTGSYTSLLYENTGKTFFLSWPGGIDQMDKNGKMRSHSFPGTKETRSFLIDADSQFLRAVSGNQLYTFAHQPGKGLQLVKSVPVIPKETFGYPFPVEYKNRLYIATDAGIFSAFNGAIRPETSPESVRYIARIQDSFLLAGRLQTGLFLYAFKRTASGNYLVAVDSLLNFHGSRKPVEKIRCIYVDEKNTAWIGTRTDGIFTCTIQQGKLKLLKQNQPSPEFNNPIVWYIFRNADQRLLALTSDEVYELTDTPGFLSLRKFSGFGLSGHLEYVSWDDQSYWLLTSDALWNIPFSGNSPVHPYAVFFTSLSNENRVHFFPAPGQVFHFPYNRNSCELLFSSNYFIDEKQVQYRHRINGKEWSAWSFNHSLSLFGLAPGRYQVDVMARLPDGRETTAVTLQMIIDPPFYKSTWFLMLCVISGSAVIYWFYRNKLMRIRNEEKIRNKIARDLHDDIGSTLSGIHLSSKAALQKAESDAGAAVPVLQKISHQTGQMMEAMSDIVWSINPQNDTVDDLLVRMKEYAAEILEAAQIGYRFDTDAKTGQRKLDVAVRKEIFLLFKEAVNNAARHSGCQEVQIFLEQQHRWLVLRITDDGRGFDTGLPGSGNGLRNMKERAAHAKGSCTLQSTPGKGTVVEFRLPVT